MVVAEMDPLKFRLPSDLKDEWDKMLAEKKITQQDAGVALVRWVLGLEDLSRSVVLGQLRAEGDAELAELIYRRLMGKGPLFKGVHTGLDAIKQRSKSPGSTPSPRPKPDSAEGQQGRGGRRS